NLGLAANVEPLPYLPLLNPLELPTSIGALVAFTWRKRLHELDPTLRTKRSSIALCVLLFCFWNTLLARAVHHYAGVPFDWSLLLRSSARSRCRGPRSRSRSCGRPIDAPRAPRGSQRQCCSGQLSASCFCSIST